VAVKLPFRSAALVVAIISSLALATSAAAAAAPHSPAQAAAHPAHAGAGHGPAAQTAGGTPLWRRAYGKKYGGDAVAVAVSPDSSTVFVTGTVDGPSHQRIATVAYRAATGTQLWVTWYNGPVRTHSTATSVAVSPDGQRVFVTGTTTSKDGHTGVTLAYDAATGAGLWTAADASLLSFATSAAVSPDASTVYSTGRDDAGMLTIAYNAASGAIMWTRVYSGPQSGGGAAAVAVSPDGSTVYVTGGVMASPGDEEYATVAYQAASGTMRWARVQNGTNGSFGDDSAATALVVSPDGNTVFVTGLLTAPAGASYGTLAYNAAVGTKLWLQQYETPSATTFNDFAAALAVSPDGTQVFVTGGANNAYGTVAYAAATGAQQWVDLYHPGCCNGASSVAVSPDGSTVYVTGTAAYPHQSSKFATLAYNAATGATNWLRRYPGDQSGLGEGRSVAVSPDGSAVFVTGLGQDPLNQPSFYTTAAYSP
jgi:DNA-binding beta-propeller fold protein YncE